MPNMTTRGGNVQVIKTEAAVHHYQFIGIEFVGRSEQLEPDDDDRNREHYADQRRAGPAALQLRPLLHPPEHLAAAHPPRVRAAQRNTSTSSTATSRRSTRGGDSKRSPGGTGWATTTSSTTTSKAPARTSCSAGRPTGCRARAVDVVIRGNHIIKPLHWRTVRGYTATVKNLFELKHGSRVLVEDNIMENCWTHGQTGVAIVLKLGDYNVSPQNVTEDIIIRNNIIRHANGASRCRARDYASNSPDGAGAADHSSSTTSSTTSTASGARHGGGTFNIYMTHGPKDVTSITTRSSTARPRSRSITIRT